MDWTYQFVVNRFLGLNQCEFLRRNQANTLCGFFLMSLLVFLDGFKGGTCHSTCTHMTRGD